MPLYSRDARRLASWRSASMHMAQRVAATRLAISSDATPSFASSSSTLRFATEHGKQSIA